MGWRPTGSSLSCVGPAIGRLMFANRPPLSLFHVQTLGGVYSLIFSYTRFFISFSGEDPQGLSQIPRAPSRDRQPCRAGDIFAHWRIPKKGPVIGSGSK